jgi:hypothetical protein
MSGADGEPWPRSDGDDFLRSATSSVNERNPQRDARAKFVTLLFWDPREAEKSR